MRPASPRGGFKSLKSGYLGWVREAGPHPSLKLPHFISLFENDVRSDAGQASDRFHTMMGEVQRTPDRAGKAAILRQYLEAEKDPHHRNGARYYLDLIEQKLNEEAL